jgi:hypothetical protein
MSEWWTYELSDFLMFSGETYWRLVERHNREAWPAQLFALVVGALLAWLAAARKPMAVPAMGAVLALAWFHVGWAFHWQAFTPINWGARYLAWGFWVQAMLLLGVALRPGPRARPTLRARWGGLALAGAGLGLYPLITALSGGSLARAEVAGVMPEPTALVTIGLLIATRSTRYGFLLALPLLSLAAGWTTLWLLHSQ